MMGAVGDDAEVFNTHGRRSHDKAPGVATYTIHKREGGKDT